MAAFEQIDALRKQNKSFLHKLKKQTEQLRQLTLSCPDKVDEKHSSVYEAFIAESGPHRAPLTLRNRAQPPRASLTTPATAAKTSKTPDKRLPGDCEVPTPDPHKTKPNQSLELSTYSALLQDTANSRWKGQSRSLRLKLSKSAPLSSCDQRETDSSTTAGLEMDTISERNIRPLLGYDWIAGLVDAESSLEDRSEQFFSDLSRFRQANRDECVHSLLSGFPSVADLASPSFDSDEPQPHTDTHQCTFCYRINSRLFAVPLDAQAACPVCKMPKSEHPHTEREPALIRVSIPRSTLLPAYKYKAHRRSSFDPSDSLGLPSHCLSGWSNPTLNSGSQMSSLDLRGSMAKPAPTGGSASSLIDNELDSSLPNASRRRHSDQLQNVVRFPRYHFQHSDPKRPQLHDALE
ncbi:migration and invasion-inhibitory protein-like [Sinocyclocheilus anshuiensis]|uniref:Migration and invasion-inhibitory protein-like n=1 Tax=Sinocyclocheilus anshuiensis TaxID=1608454 RepID=A0A671LQ69_9TELE|nr:PREDICTED: migration and invasion-inhibitory protein-like [Sinocyclocheilus anshuiensis]